MSKQSMRSDERHHTEEKPQSTCGVAGCWERGTPAICPFDGSRHSHGMVHYGGGYPDSALTFDDGWHWLCPSHLAIVTAERIAWEKEQRAKHAEPLCIEPVYQRDGMPDGLPCGKPRVHEVHAGSMGRGHDFRAPRSKPE